MNDMRQDAWFYSREGERIGPVTFADLQIKAKDGELNPRLDMAWTHGMDEWKASGEIEGLFERREPEKKDDLAPPTDPYTPPKEESVERRMSREGTWPGARRRGYLAGTIVFPILWQMGLTASAAFLGKQLGAEMIKLAAIVLPLVPVPVCIYFGVKRLLNVGMSGWWWLGNFVPILNFWVGYRCFACPAGYAYHKKLDGIGVFLAIVYWLLILLVIVAVLAVVALLFGMIGSPEVQEKIRDAIQQGMQHAPKP